VSAGPPAQRSRKILTSLTTIRRKKWLNVDEKELIKKLIQSVNIAEQEKHANHTKKATSEKQDVVDVLKLKPRFGS